MKHGIDINGTYYELRFDMYTMELVQDALGSVNAAFDALRGGTKIIKTVTALFVAMANSALSAEGKPETVTADVVRRLSPVRMSDLQTAVIAAMQDGMRTETSERETDEDEYLSEARKNAEGGKKAAK